MIVKLDKIVKNRIYLSSQIQIEGDNVNDTLNLFLYDYANFNNLISLLDSIRFIPITKSKLLFPIKVLNPLSLSPVGNIKERAAYVKELKSSPESSKITLVNDLDFLKEKNNDNKNPCIVDLTAYTRLIDPYILEHKKTVVQKYQYMKLILNKIISEYSPILPKKPRLFISFSGSDPVLSSNLFFIIYGLKKDFLDFSIILSKVDIILVDTKNGIFLETDLSDKKRIQNTLNMIAKFSNIGKNFDAKKSIQDGEVTVGDATEIKEAEANSFIDHITSDQVFTVDKMNTVSDSEVLKIVATAEEINKSDDIASSEDISKIEVSNEIDLDEILLTQTDSEYTKKEIENKEFLLKFKDRQDKAIGELLSIPRNIALIEEKVIDNSVMNESIKSARLSSITNSYYKNLYKRDIGRILVSLNNDIDNPVVVNNFSMKPNSDPLNLKDEISVGFTDKTGGRHTFTVDVPKLSHDGFMYINGNRKFIAKQSILLPVVKESPDRVQITTNYRKTFLYRKGEKTNALSDRLYKTLTAKKFTGVKQMYGNAFVSNIDKNVSIPYNFFAKKLMSVAFSDGKGSDQVLNVFFSQKIAKYHFTAYKVSLKPNENPIALRMNGDKVFSHYVEDRETFKILSKNSKGETVKEYISILEFLAEVIKNHKNPDLYNSFKDTGSGKVFAYTEIKIAAASLPLGILVAFYKGLIETLDLIKVSYEVDTTKRRAKEGELAIIFSDATIFIDCKNDTSKELIVNGLYYLDTKLFSIKDSERRGPIYLDYFGQTTGSRNTGKALLNFESSMIDPITEEILIDLKLPTKFTELLLYGNSLLNGFTYKRKNDMTNFRIRDSETIAVGLYNVLMKSFNEYKRSSKTGSTTRISAPKDAVIKHIMTVPNIEDYSTLSPFLEIETKAKTTYKGPSGLILAPIMSNCSSKLL